MEKESKMISECCFSIIMPTYNRAFCICDAVDSVLKQKYENFELIVIDDGSTDNTEEILKHKYTQELFSGKLKYLRVEHGGVSFARNKGLQIASNEWIGYLDTDNLMCENYFHVFDSVIKKHENKMFYAQIRHLHSGKVVGKPYDERLFCRWSLADMNAFVHHVSLYRALGGFDEKMNRLVDWELMLRYSRKNIPLFIPKVVVEYNDSQEIKRISNTEDAEEMRQIIYDRYLPEKKVLKKKKILIRVDMFQEKNLPSDDAEIFREYMDFYWNRFVLFEKKDTDKFNLLIKVPKNLSLFLKNKIRALEAFYDFVKVYDDDGLVDAVQEAADFEDGKVVGFIVKDCVPEDLVSVLDRILRGSLDGETYEAYEDKVVVISSLDKAKALQ